MPTALWATQVAHLTKQAKSSQVKNNRKHRHLFCDNYYTRHSFAIAIDKLTDGETKVTGTMRLNYIDGINK